MGMLWTGGPAYPQDPHFPAIIFTNPQKQQCENVNLWKIFFGNAPLMMLLSSSCCCHQRSFGSNEQKVLWQEVGYASTHVFFAYRDEITPDVRQYV